MRFHKNRKLVSLGRRYTIVIAGVLFSGVLAIILAMTNKDTADTRNKKTISATHGVTPKDETIERNSLATEPINEIAAKNSELQIVDPETPSEVDPALFGLIPEQEFIADVERLTSETPLGDGRFEQVDETGNVIARAMRSRKEEETLGYVELQRYKESQLSPAELRSLAASGDAAADVALALFEFAYGDRRLGRDLIIRATQRSRLPAALALAGQVHDTLEGDLLLDAMAAGWFIAAYIRGDHTVVLSIERLMSGLPEMYQTEAVLFAQGILDDLLKESADK